MILDLDIDLTLVTKKKRSTHAKYESSITYNPKLMVMLKFFVDKKRETEKQTDKAKSICP